MSVMELRRRLLEQLQHFDSPQVRHRWLSSQGRSWTADPALVLSLIAAGRALPAGAFTIAVAPDTEDDASDVWEVLSPSLLVSYRVRVVPAAPAAARGWEEILPALQAVGRELALPPVHALTRRAGEGDAWSRVKTLAAAIAEDPTAAAYGAAIVWQALTGDIPGTPAVSDLPAHAVYERFDVLAAAQFTASTILAGIDTPVPAPIERSA